MADILTVFNLSLAELDRLSLTELMAWRERARVRCEVGQ